MRMLLFAVLCFGYLCGATQNFKHIKAVNVDSLPTVHQRDLWSFVEDFFEAPTAKRSYPGHHPDGFFHLKSVLSLSDGMEQDFVLKPVSFSPEVRSDGKLVDTTLGHIFNGYSATDAGTIIVLHLPTSEQVDPGLHPLKSLRGMVHHSSGHHFTLGHHDEHGITMTHFNTSSSPHPKCKGALDKHEGHEHHEHHEHHHKKKNDVPGNDKYVYKRSLEIAQEMQEMQEMQEIEGNGLSVKPLLQIEIAVLSDVPFSKYFPSGAASATSYVATVLAATNAIYERDFYATLVFQYFGFYTVSAPVTTLDQLVTWLQNNPAVDAKSDVATVLNGAKEGGLGYVGTVCSGSKTSECGVNAKYGTADPYAPNDLLVIAHEIGHNLGSGHTHDSNSYSPVIDSCGTQLGNPSSIPTNGGGTVMSYCHAVAGGNGFNSVKFFMGAEGLYGVQSERVNKVIRAKIEGGECLSSPDPSWAPTCTDYTPYVYSPSGDPIICANEKSLCNSGLAFIEPPYCAKTCGRCITTTTPVIGTIPLGAPVNCVWNDWGSWSLCTKTCGTGTRTASRTVKTPAQNGGTDCTGGTTKSENCNTQSCIVPVDCVWSSWSAWTGCTVLCGTGTRSATRTVTTPAANGGVDCTGGNTKSENCNTQACAPVDCQWGSWGAWSTCSATCGSGSQTRTRSITTPASNGGTCNNADATSIQACTGTSCPPVNCEWGTWSAWSICSASCGTGTRTSTRTIATPASNGGTSCLPADGTKSESCNTQSCIVPQNCVWSAWSAWTSCSAACGPGTTTRTRTVITPAQNGGTDCDPTTASESTPCNLGVCSSNCVWGAWSAWSTCSKTCGTGTRASSRPITSPATGTGTPCNSADSTKSELCNTQACPIDCAWSAWSAWSICNKECGTGTQTSTRSIVTEGANGGLLCNTFDGSRFQNCNTQACPVEPPVDCVWSLWSAWTTCSKTCGTGTSQRTRTITTQASNGGKNCDPAEGTQSSPCNTQICPVDCAWSTWSAWSTCDKTCGTGVRTATRTIVTPSQGTGTACDPNDRTLTQTCNTQPCDCLWGAWSAWGQCSKTCGTGSRVRTRIISQPATTGGVQCDNAQGSQNEACNTQACTAAPINCAWSTWSTWSTCSKLCGGGTRTQSRTVQTPASNGGTACTGTTTNTEACNTQTCPPTACVWGAWGAWGSCSTSCGSGTRSRTRKIQAEATNGGAACKSVDSISSEACNTQACTPVDCTWSAWNAWGFCSKNCGGGLRSRDRTVLSPAAFGGKCNTTDASQTAACNTQACTDTPVPCVWSEWAAWTECSERCDGGTRTTVRRVLASAQNGGECNGPDFKVEDCNVEECPSPVECTDVAIDLPVKRDGQPITCQEEALRGNCQDWHNNVPNCIRSCGWEGCKMPCDDLPNPGVEVRTKKGDLLATCSAQAAAGLCSKDWMTERACRQSCGKCGPSRVVPSGGEATVKVLESKLEWEETTRVVDQGTDCTLNKGMPTFEVYEEGAPHSYVVAADDFIVPAGKTFYLDQIHMATRWTPLPEDEGLDDEERSTVEVRATIFFNNTVRCRMTLNVIPKPLLRLNVAPYRCILVGAHYENAQLVKANQRYWLSVQSFTSDLKAPLLYWGFSESTNGEKFKWKDPADYFEGGKCPKWSAGDKCGVDTYGTDMCFRFLGYESGTTDRDRFYLTSLPLSVNEEGDDIGSDNRETGVFTDERDKKQTDQKSDVQTNLDDNREFYGGPKDINIGDINDLEYLAYVIPLAIFFTVFIVVVIVLGLAAWKAREIRRLWNADDYTAFADFE